MTHAAVTLGAARILAAVHNSPGPYLFQNYTRFLGDNKILEVVETAHLWPELEDYAGRAVSVFRASRVPNVAHLAVLAQAARTRHEPLINEWIEALSSRGRLNTDDPRLHLRVKMRKDACRTRYAGSLWRRARVLAPYVLTVTAWNAYVAGSPIDGLYLPVESWSTFKATPVVDFGC